MPTLTVAQLSELCGGLPEGDRNLVLTGASSLEEAAAGDLAFVGNPKNASQASQSKASCLLVYPEFAMSGPWALIRLAKPRLAFAAALQKLYPPRVPAAFRHASAVVHPTASIGDGVYLGPFVTVGERSVIGNRCYLTSHISIGSDVTLGEGTELRPNVVIYDRVRVGSGCLFHAGCVIGADGFGFAMAEDHYEKFPHIGSVEIGNHVELGANTCVDRAALGTTKIGDGTKLDNLVHIAHNCQVGKHVAIAAQTGFSGGVVVGDYAVIGGQVGVGDKAQIGGKAVIGSQAGILPSKRVTAGDPLWGTPARPLRQYLRILALTNKLPELNEEVDRLADDLHAIQEKLR